MEQKDNTIQVNKLKPSLIKYFLKEYDCYRNYLSKDFFEGELEKFEKEYSVDCGVCPEVLFKILIKNSVLKNLAEHVKEEDINLEIQLIDEYTPLTNLIISKMKLENFGINNEEVLIKAIESYDGTKLFSLHIVETIRKEFLESNNRPPVENKRKKLDQSISNYLALKKDTENKPTYIDSLVKEFGIINYTEDDDWKKYIYLRFGYFENKHLKTKAISDIIGISQKRCIDLYKNTLLRLKEVLNTKINDIPTFNYEDNKKLIKIKKIDQFQSFILLQL